MGVQWMQLDAVHHFARGLDELLERLREGTLQGAAVVEEVEGGHHCFGRATYRGAYNPH